MGLARLRLELRQLRKWLMEGLGFGKENSVGGRGVAGLMIAAEFFLVFGECSGWPLGGIIMCFFGIKVMDLFG